ncbi:MAG: alpha/beta fold hydrolase [Myxococcota bacterium]
MAGESARVETADGYTLHAEAHGEGTPVVFSCGLCTTSVSWHPQIEPFVAAGLRIVLWDYRGHGRSDAPDDPSAYHLDRVVDDLARVLDWAAPGVPAIVGGLSFGGLASLHLALRQPERVRALLLVDTGPGFKNPEAQARWEAQVERTAGFAETRGMRAFVESRAAATMTGLHPERPATRAAADAIAAQTPHGIAHFARRVAGPASPVIDQLAEIYVPALVIVGEKDDAYLRASEVLEKRLPQAERVVVPGGGHVVNLDEPEAFNAAALRFAGSLG